MSQPPPPPGNPPPGPNSPQAANPYAAPVPPDRNPYASAPTQPAYPQDRFPPGGGYQSQGYGGPQPYASPPPYAQQPYGYGRQPLPPPQRRSSGRVVAIIAGVVAAVLVIGGGVFLAAKGGGDDKKAQPVASSGGPSGGTDTAKPHGSTLSFRWDKDADTVARKDNLKDALGVWFTDKYVVKNEIGKVVGYDLTTGAQAWTIPAPARGDCTAARDAYQNRTAIQYGASCEKVMAIDLAAGKELWTAALPGGTGGRTDFDYSEMAVSGDTVGVDWLDGSVAYRLSDQKVLWRSGDGDCEDDGYAGGRQFVAIVNCDYKTYKVQVIDPANNGSAKWSWQAPVGTKVSAIVSTDPVVVLLGTEGETFTDVATIVNGRLQSRVSLGTDKYDIENDGTEKQAVHNVLVSGDTVYLTLRSKSDGSGQVLSGIVAFGLADGKQKWVAKPDGKHDITGLDFLDGKLLAYEPASYDVRGRLVTLDPATGAIETYADFAADSYDRLDSSAMRSYYVWHNGRFYIVTKTVYASSSGQKYLVSFG